MDMDTDESAAPTDGAWKRPRDGNEMDEAFKRIRIDQNPPPPPVDLTSAAPPAHPPLHRSSSVPGAARASAPLARANSLPPGRPAADDDAEDIEDYDYENINSFLNDLHLAREHRRASVG